jgi:NAD(P)H dehydrogenase (quinone)
MGQTQMDMSGKEAVLDSGDRLTAEKFGQRIAQATLRWKKGEF